MNDINLFYPAIITNIITVLLLLNSKLHDRYLLFVMVIGQLILINGESDKNLDKIHNQIFVLILLLITIISRYILSECLFNMSNSHHDFEFESSFDFINYDYLFYISIIILSYRLFKDKIISNV